MLSLSGHRRGEEKLEAVLAQLAAVRARLNSLAWQDGIFPALAILIGAATLILIAAITLSTDGFLTVFVICAIAVPLGLISAARNTWRRHLSVERAATVVDQRADLKGRLAAVYAVAQFRRRPALWRYLVEDADGRRESFAPVRIERRLVSRTIYALLAACLFAFIALPLALHYRRATVRAEARAAAVSGQLTLNLQNLHLEPAAPGDQADFQVAADAAAMRQLREQAAAQGAGAGGAVAGANPFSRLMNHASALAGRLQDKLNGHHTLRTHLTLKLADASNPQPSFASRPLPGESAGPQQSLQDFQFKGHNAYGDTTHVPIDPRQYERQRHAAVPGAASASPVGGSRRQNSNSPTAPEKNNMSKFASGVAGGSSHGIGASPENLFGPPQTPTFGHEGFAITIQARPADRGQDKSGNAYVPPKVTVPLNPHQFPDQPMARANIPARDRVAVKRVFER